MPGLVTAITAHAGLTAWVTSLGDLQHLGTGPVPGSSGSPVLVGLSVSRYHALLLSGDGAVHGFGTGEHGQLGLGPVTQAPTPEALPLPAAAQVFAGEQFSLVLSVTGQLFSFGMNHAGQLGDGTTAQRSAPTAVALPGPVTTVAAGDAHVLAAVDEDGEATLYSWGDNDAGQLGDGTTTRRCAPGLVAPPTPGGWTQGITCLAAGAAHSLAVDGAGGLWAWGRGEEGQLGLGPLTSALRPTRVAGVPAVAGAACGALSSFVWTSDGRLFAFGDNSFGQLGVGDLVSRGAPVELDAASPVARVSAGAWHSIALTQGGGLLAWGLTHQGQAGSADAYLPHLSAGWVTRPTALKAIT